MSWWHRLWRQTKLEEQLDKELRFHLEQHAADLIAGAATRAKHGGKPGWRWAARSR